MDPFSHPPSLVTDIGEVGPTLMLLEVPHLSNDQYIYIYMCIFTLVTTISFYK